MIEGFHVVASLWFFAVGAVVGSFLNVCIYRLPWQKSVVWPDSRCPRCLGAITARDNIPILSWLWLRGRCRHCGLPIPARYLWVEALVGALFVAAYQAEVGLRAVPMLEAEVFARLGYHLILVSLLVAATFIDYDYQVIPDAITRTGMVLGIVLGGLFPDLRPVPSGPKLAGTMSVWGAFWPGLVGAAIGGGAAWVVRTLVASAFDLDRKPTAEDPSDEEFGLPAIGAFLGWQVAVIPRWQQWGGVVVGLQGLLVGGAIVWVFRIGGRLVLRREAMGFGDVTLMAMIGSFLGWQAAVLTFFLAPFIGLAHALWKLVLLIGKRRRGGQSSVADHEMPFGPYLAMAAAALMLAWPWLWPRWAEGLFATLAFLIG